MHNTCKYTAEATSFIQHIHVVHTHKTSNIHLVQAFNMFMTIYKENTIVELNTRILILRRSFPTTRFVVATFHPTIGQCAPYSLSITATLELGMISTGNQGTQTYTQQGQTPIVKPVTTSNHS